MLLYIVRHGIAIDREDPKCPSDPERYLTADGIKRTRDVAKSVAALYLCKPLRLIRSKMTRLSYSHEN